MSKKVIQINTVCYGSVGNIMKQIEIALLNKGYDTISFYGRGNGYSNLPCERFGNFIGFWLHVVWTTITDKQGMQSYFATKKMITRLREENPDVIHLHNIHGYYLNYPLMFKYFRKEFSGRLVWTFHDCWPMTGHCPYFTMKKCERWKELCKNCPNRKLYPASWFADSSKSNYKKKKKMFSQIENMTIICPSVWMYNIVKESFLKNANSIVISNGIDLDIFYPRKENDLIKKYNIPNNKKIVLGVANIWEERKGFGIFIELAKAIGDNYIIVLVGVNKHQVNKMLPNMIGIEKTDSKEELAEIYSCANVFMNPSEEESFSLVTVEALACGTPVIALDNSAVKEMINGENGIVLHNPEIRDYVQAISECESRNISEDIICRSVQRYNIDNMTNAILEVYK